MEQEKEFTIILCDLNPDDPIAKFEKVKGDKIVEAVCSLDLPIMKGFMPQYANEINKQKLNETQLRAMPVTTYLPKIRKAYRLYTTRTK